MKKLFLFALLLVSCASFAAEDLMSVSAITERTAPVGHVNVSGQAAKPTATPVVEKKVVAKRTGKAIYQKHCHVCHANGVAGAPKFRTTAWKKYSADGLDHMLEEAIKGVNAMPPKGTCTDCSNDEMKAAIKYMLPQ